VNIFFKNGAVKAVAEKSFSWHLAVATFFGAGYSPKAPGTVGSLAAMLILLLPLKLIFPALLAGIFLASILSISAISVAERELGSDAGAIVIDEVIGIWIVLLHPATHDSIAWAIAGFALFRLFDIWKPFPINLLNNKKGAFFVLADDVLAGLFALCLLALAQKFFF
jgi:phosphatidylglycerophosphatase A